jgi:hypothetical protein
VVTGGPATGEVPGLARVWRLQAEAEPVTVDALETILARSTVPILRQLEERPAELVLALLPSLDCTMLAAFVEVMAEQRPSRHRPWGHQGCAKDGTRVGCHGESGRRRVLPDAG